VGYLGKAHQTHAIVNNRQADHQSTVLEMTGTIVDETLSIFIDLGAIESFISGVALKIIKVKEVKLHPISRMPYQMSTLELQELRMQLKELLYLGLICPSVSPWGALFIFI
jgi:hypothetical protein